MKKIYVFASIMLLLLVSAFIFLGSAVFSAASPNTLIKGSGDAVYFLGEDMKRYVFSNSNIYFSWYENFSGVVTVSDSELSSYQLGGNINYRPGTRLIKIVSDPSVYAVGPEGTLHAIPDESSAKDLYGNAWADLIDDLPDSFFTDYQIEDPLNQGYHPEGTVFVQSDTYYMLHYFEDIPKVRTITPAMKSFLRINPSFALTLPSQYPIEGELTSVHQSLAYPDQKNIAESDEPPAEEVPDATPATITVKRLSNLGSALTAVKNDPEATIYALTLTGDKVHKTTINNIRLTFYIDAGGEDDDPQFGDDFQLGSDQDRTILWNVSQALHDVAIRNASSGETYATKYRLSAEGSSLFSTSISLDPKEIKTINITANIDIAPPDQIRLSVDLNPATDVVATSLTASSVSVSPNSILNNSTSPSTIATFEEHGSLTVGSSTTEGDSIQILGGSDIPYQLIFSSIGEPFTVKTFTLQTTSLGSDVYAIDKVNIEYNEESGKNKIVEHNSITGTKIDFINLAIHVPKNTSVVVPIEIITKDVAATFSNSRLQIEFIPDAFFSSSHTSMMNLTSVHFSDNSKLTQSTSASPLTVYRQSVPSFGSHSDSPKDTSHPFEDTSVLVFNISAEH